VNISDFKNQQKSGKWNNGESSNLQSTFPYIIKLAPESPTNKPIEAHDESSYDSFHNWETGKSLSLDTDIPQEEELY
jgi:hypothetical protein